MKFQFHLPPIVNASILAVILSSSFTADAQFPTAPGAAQDDRMQALRIAYFVEQLQLNSQESAQFWPIWNEAEIARDQMSERIKELEEAITSASSDAEAKAAFNRLHDLHVNMMNQRKETIEKAASVIGFQRAAQIPQIEREFRSHIMRRRMGGDAGATPPNGAAPRKPNGQRMQPHR